MDLQVLKGDKVLDFVVSGNGRIFVQVEGNTVGFIEKDSNGNYLLRVRFSRSIYLERTFSYDYNAVKEWAINNLHSDLVLISKVKQHPMISWGNDGQRSLWV